MKFIPALQLCHITKIIYSVSKIRQNHKPIYFREHLHYRDIFQLWVKWLNLLLSTTSYYSNQSKHSYSNGFKWLFLTYKVCWSSLQSRGHKYCWMCACIGYLRTSHDYLINKKLVFLRVTPQFYCKFPNNHSQILRKYYSLYSEIRGELGDELSLQL